MYFDVNMIKTAPHSTYFTLHMLRGVAAISVALFHINIILGGTPWLPGSYLSVDLFFVLSGFVLSHAYADKIRSGVTTFDFLKQRFRRLYPLYMFGTILGVIVHFASKQFSRGLLSDLPLAVALLPFPPLGLGLRLFPLNGPAWSLFYELLVNALLPLTIRHPIAMWIAAAIGLLGLSVTALSNHSLDAGLTWPGAPIAMSRALFGFFLGVIAHRYRHITNFFTRWHLLSYPLIALVISGAMRSVFGGAGDLISAVVIAPSIVLFGAEQNVLALDRRIAQFVGNVSFPLYILHEPLILFAKFWHFHSIGYQIVIFIAIIIASSLAYIFIDKPLQVFAKRRQN